MSELKSGVMRTPHNEGMVFDRGSSRISVTEDETEFYLKSEVDAFIVQLRGEVTMYRDAYRATKRMLELANKELRNLRELRNMKEKTK